MAQVKSGLWIKLLMMALALGGIIYFMSYLRSGEVVDNPNSPVNALFGDPNASERKARIVIEPTPTPSPSAPQKPQDP